MKTLKSLARRTQRGISHADPVLRHLRGLPPGPALPPSPPDPALEPLRALFPAQATEVLRQQGEATNAR